MDFLKIDSYKIASHIFYFWKFAKIETKAKFENLRQNIRNLLKKTNTSLSMDPGEIDNKIIKIILFKILIGKQICSKGAKKKFLI